MIYEDANDDRLTKNEFAELIQHLSVQELLTIEYRDGPEWNKLFCRKNFPQQIFFCNLCALETSSFKNLLAHIDGKKHKLQMERVKQLYHPDYTHPKNNKRDGVEKSLCKNNESIVASFSSNQHEAPGDNMNEKLQIVENMKCSSNLSTNIEIKKPIDILNDKKQLESLNSSTHNIKQKELENTVNIVTKNKEEQNRAILLTLDKSKLSEELSTIKSNSRKEKQILKSIGEIRSSWCNNNEKYLENRKIVINPAAKFSMRAWKDLNEETSEKPHYKTDKIVIPTVHTQKSCYNKASPANSLQAHYDAPKFSVKSYSCNPIDNDVCGILGVEYVIKILKNRNDVSPRYECGLCELVLDGFSMQRHLEGYNHRLKFCEKHFPTAIRQYRQYMLNVPDNEIFKVMTPVLGKLAVAIEKHFGRNLPYECWERDFSLNRQEILSKAYSCRHASEQYGPTFTHVVGSNEIDVFIKNRHMYSPAPFSRKALFDKSESSDCKPNNHHYIYANEKKERCSRDRNRHDEYENMESNDVYKDMYSSPTIYNQTENINLTQHVDDEIYNLMVDDFLKGTLKGFSERGSQSCNRSSQSPARKSSSGKRKSLSPLRENDVWQAYRHMVDQELYNLDERFHLYRKDPETHPSYNEEWQKFWKRRKDELVAAGLDHRKYNYQPEWVRFVKIRIEELYGQEVESIKIKSRNRLYLPLTNEHIPDVKYHLRTPATKLTNKNFTPQCSTDSTIELSSTLTSLYPSNKNIPQVVSVLRLMTALEDSLGNFGPKVTNLLSKALQTEKSYPLQVNAIILNDENCSIIETAKEKFKELVTIGFFEGSKKKVVTELVSDTEKLLQYAHQFRKQLASERSSVEIAMNRTQINSSAFLHFASLCTKDKQSNIPIYVNKSQSSNENIRTLMDKKELASKLAASLVAQGKTDFDPRYLHELIAVYKLIEKKKSESTCTGLSNKRTIPEPTSSKKTLSDTLSDLLRTSTSSVCKAPDVSAISKTFHTASRSTNPKPVDTSCIVPEIFGKSVSPTMSTSVQQNSSDNYINNASDLKTKAFDITGRMENQNEPRSDYVMNNSDLYYNNYQYNNGIMPNWEWSSNMDMNQNYTMGRHNNFD